MSSATPPNNLTDAPSIFHADVGIADGILPAASPSMNMPESIPPKIAFGIVKAQAAAYTVENDGYNSYHKYNYPTQAAIADRARLACEVGGIAIMLLGWRTWKDDDGTVHVTAPVDVIHESGERLPRFDASMPVIAERGKSLDKAIAGSLSILRKYVTGQLLNMGWRDKSEDVDQRDDRQANAPKLPTPKPHVRASPPPKPAPVGVPPDIVESARKAISVLRTQFDYESPGKIYEIATGRDPEWPSEAVLIDFMAIVQMASVCEALAADGSPVPASHDDYVKSAYEFNSQLLRPYFKGGEVSPAGTSALEVFKGVNDGAKQ